VDQPEREPSERRSSGSDRRTYNRRSSAAAVSPPYYEAFERIAVAIEKIGALLDQRQLRLPDTDRPSAVTPRSSSERRS
jgi:hypothetical protein